MIGSQKRSCNRLLLIAVLLLRPGKTKNRILNILPGVLIHPSATVGRMLILDTARITLGPNARLGSLNIIRGLIELRLASGACIGTLNIITSSQAFDTLPDDGHRGRLCLEAESAVTNRHYLDCSGGVSVGELATIAGCRSTILTHQIDLSKSRQVIQPVKIGQACFVGSNVSMVPGAVVADRVVVAMGAVVRGTLELAGELYGGVPARPLGPANNEAYASRLTGPVEVIP